MRRSLRFQIGEPAIAEGDEVVGFDVLRYGGESLLGSISDSRFSFKKLDLRKASTREFEGLDAVAHLAALVGPICDKFPGDAWETNVGATEMICRVASEQGIRVLLASTCSNYGTLAGVADENSPLNPLGVYAQTKVAAENLFSAMEDQALVL